MCAKCLPVSVQRQYFRCGHIYFPGYNTRGATTSGVSAQQLRLCHPAPAARTRCARSSLLPGIRAGRSRAWESTRRSGRSGRTAQPVRRRERTNTQTQTLPRCFLNGGGLGSASASGQERGHPNQQQNTLSSEYGFRNSFTLRMLSRNRGPCAASSRAMSA